jgi:L-ascorbate metabolism protein UlaG (beta-lactamase superfamily)
MKRILLIPAVLLIHLCLSAQNAEKPDPDKKTDWWGDPGGYLNQQAKLSLAMADDALKMYPPSVDEPAVRKMALMLIDNVLHEEKAAHRPSVQAFFHSRIENAVNEICTEKVEKGALIWKIYNHTFIIKTPSVTIGFDIQRGVQGVDSFRLDKNLMQKLINAVDILFVTHTHNDHADAWVAETFLSQNKPVVTPPDIWKGTTIYSKILHPERKADIIQEISLPKKGFNLKIINFPGHQGETLLNNVYLVFTPEGLSFSHTGDQSNIKDFDWIDHIGDKYRVDVVMTNSWSFTPGQRLANGYRPRLIIAGHENELGHTIDHREPYWLNNLRLGETGSFPWIELAWGEKFHYPQYTTLNAHSHNDYVNPIPFRLAYDNHFGSVETDIWAVNNELYVAHSKAEIKPANTLDSLYIQPIVKIFRKNLGKAWIDYSSSFQLLVDLKTLTEPTLSLLVEKLKNYPDVFDTNVSKNAVRVVITGNRPVPADFSKYPEFINYDGIIGQDYNEQQLKKVALYSENIKIFTPWNGEGSMVPKDKIRLQHIIDSVHAQNKKIRFWNAPDDINAWETFISMGVDYINTDHIVKLAEFLNQQHK